MIGLESILSWFKSLVEGINNIGTLLSEGVPAALYPIGATPLNETSGNGAATIVTATLEGAVGQTTYIEGFDVTSGGSTTAALVTITVTDSVVSGLLLGYTYATVAGVTSLNAGLSIRYPRPIPASETGASIAVSLPSLGSGNTKAIINAYGFRV